MARHSPVGPVLSQIHSLEPRRLLAFVADGAFGVSGLARFDPASSTIATSIAVTSSGKVLVAGTVAGLQDDTYVSRLDPTGTADASFGSAGVRQLPAAFEGQSQQVLETDSGAILIAGDGTVARLTASGAIDTAFSGDGVLPVGADNIALSPDGAIYTASGTVIRRYTASGIDNTFNGTGALDLSTDPLTADLVSENPEPIILLRPMPDGRVGVGVDATDESGLGDAFVIRLNTNGSINTAYASGSGVAIIPTLGAMSLADMVVLPDTQTLVLLNSEGTQNATYALTGSGNPKSGSEPTSLQLRAAEAYADEASAVAVRPDGTPVIVGGFAETENDYTYAAAMKLNGDFSVDTDFAIDGDGIATLDPRLGMTDGFNGLAFAAAATDEAVYVLVRTGAGNGIMKLADDPDADFGITRSGSTINIASTDVADRILVGQRRGRVIVSVGGERASFRVNGAPAININTAGGDDVVSLDPSLTARSININLGDGNDTLDAFDTFGGSPRRVFAGAGDDLVRILSAPTVAYGEAGRDSLYGSFANDALFGGDDNDLVVGGTGDDYLEGNAGRDTLDGSAGNDRLLGHTGNDFLAGGKGDDSLYGQSGDDVLNGGPGADYLDASSGRDTLLAADNTRDTLFGGSDTDQATVDVLDIVDGIEVIA